MRHLTGDQATSSLHVMAIKQVCICHLTINQVT